MEEREIHPQAEHGREIVANESSTLARALQAAAEQAQHAQGSIWARPLSEAAERCGEFARSVKNRSTAEMLRDADEFGRRQPLMLFGAAAAAGLLIARFLNSNSSRTDDSP